MFCMTMGITSAIASIDNNATASLLHPSSIDLPEQSRIKTIDILNTALANMTNLALATKNAHWNVKGMQFISLHKLFDEIYNELVQEIDTVAERITALAGTALGTLQETQKGTTIGSYPSTIFSGKEHLQTLSGMTAVVGAMLRENIQRCSDLGDWDSADVFTELSRKFDKRLWFLQAHLQ